jgi:hypothetical protein
MVTLEATQLSRMGRVKTAVLDWMIVTFFAYRRHSAHEPQQGSWIGRIPECHTIVESRDYVFTEYGTR